MPLVVMRAMDWKISPGLATVLEQHGHIWRYDDDLYTYGVVGESESVEEEVNAAIVAKCAEKEAEYRRR